MAKEELKWQNIDADDLPADVKQSFDALVAAEARAYARCCIAAMTPRSGASGVVRILALNRRSRTSSATSVKVPPISTPARKERALMAPDPISFALAFVSCALPATPMLHAGGHFSPTLASDRGISRLRMTLCQRTLNIQ